MQLKMVVLHIALFAFTTQVFFHQCMHDGHRTHQSCSHEENSDEKSSLPCSDSCHCPCHSIACFFVKYTPIHCTESLLDFDDYYSEPVSTEAFHVQWKPPIC